MKNLEDYYVTGHDTMIRHSVVLLVAIPSNLVSTTSVCQIQFTTLIRLDYSAHLGRGHKWLAPSFSSKVRVGLQEEGKEVLSGHGMLCGDKNMHVYLPLYSLF